MNLWIHVDTVKLDAVLLLCKQEMQGGKSEHS